MNDYDIKLTDAQANRIAVNVVNNNPSELFLVRLIAAAMGRLEHFDTGFERVVTALAKQGITAEFESDRPNLKPKPKSKAKASRNNMDVNDEGPVRKSSNDKDWPERKVSAKLITDAIARHGITTEDLKDDYELSAEEVDALHRGDLEKFTRRELAEIAEGLIDLDSPLLTRLGDEIWRLLDANPWLDEQELIMNYELGTQEVEFIQKGRWSKFTLENLAKLLQTINTCVNAVMREENEPIVPEDANGRIIRIKRAFGLSLTAIHNITNLSAKERLRLTHEQPLEDDSAKRLMSRLEGIVLAPSTIPSEYFREVLIANLTLLRVVFDVSDDMLRTAGFDKTEINGVNEHRIWSFSGRELFDLVEKLKLYLLSQRA